MTDDADKAQELEDRARDRAVGVRRPIPVAVGLCYNCEKPCEGSFCCPDCLEDWEWRTQRKRDLGLL